MTASPAHAVQPNAIVELYSPNPETPDPIIIYASDASFGESLGFGQATFPPLPVRLAPPNNPRLCDEPALVPDVSSTQRNFIILAPRGGCAFADKAYHAQLLGARHVIIYETLSNFYESSVPEIIRPRETIDYECSNGIAWIPKFRLSFEDVDDNTTYDTANDALLSGSEQDGNLCAEYHNLAYSETMGNFEDICESQRCVLTNTTMIHSPTNQQMKACCAWDFHVSMGSDKAKDVSKVDITATFLTMKEFDRVQEVLEASQNVVGSTDEVLAVVYERKYPRINLSSFFLCVLGTFVVWFSGWKSAEPYRIAKKKLETVDITRNAQNNNSQRPPSYVMSPRRSDNNAGHDLALDVQDPYDDDTSALGEVEMTPVQTATTSNAAEQSVSIPENGQEQSQQQVRQRPNANDETMNLKVHHVVFFIVAASATLLVLFYAKMYDVVRVFYVIGGCVSLSQLVLSPGLLYIANRFSKLSFLSKLFCKDHFMVLDIVSFLGSCGIGALWLWLSFTRNDAHMHPFYWIVQDLMGACICIIFLALIRLNSVKIATILLVAAFIYDIFFVFLTPYIFGESVMMTVASGGGGQQGSELDSAFCEKYPTDSNCDKKPLPMLFAIPRINDYRGGLSMLGLGDIVLPGLLCCFAARLDGSKSLLKSLRIRQVAVRRGFVHIRQFLPPKRAFCARLFSGYFFQIILAYAIGLLAATLAVYLMQKGQPALMYIVPLTLTVLVIRGHVHGQLSSLWSGPARLVNADEVVYIISSKGVEEIDNLAQESAIYVVTGSDLSFISSESELEIEAEGTELPEIHTTQEENVNRVV